MKISLDRFRAEYTNEDGSPKYDLIGPHLIIDLTQNFSGSSMIYLS